jgi:hypothetical protein
MARLLINSDGVRERVLELRLGVNRIGRSADNDFRIEHPTVSSHHCEIILESGGVRLRDCGSTNGTFLNGRQVGECDLQSGQTLALGDVQMSVDSAEVTVAIPKFRREMTAPPVVLEGGGIVCPRHPKAQATHQCTGCRELLCDACVTQLRRRGGKLLKLCPLCSHPVERIGAAPRKRRTFFGLLSSTVKLPFLHRKES